MHLIDSKGRKIDIDVSWLFDILKEKLNLKLKYLVIIKAENKIIDGDEYFKYSEISFYELRDFDKFLSWIEQGILTVTFNIDIFKSGKRIG